MNTISNDTSRPRKKLLYFAGFGRSGSTLLGKCLGSVSCATNVGELSFIWDRAYCKDDPCGCGKPFSQCTHWNSILSSAFAPHELTPSVLRYSDQPLPRNRDLLLSMLRNQPPRLPDEGLEYRNTLSKLYGAIYEKTGAELIIDSSKFPSYLLALTEALDVDFYIIHLVRDPRASAYSWSKQIRRSDSASGSTAMERYTTWDSTKKWVGWNALFALLLRRMASDRIKTAYLPYELFARSPRSTILRILEFLEMNQFCEETRSLFTEPDLINLGPDHSIWGNPGRLSQGSIKIREDIEWETKMPLIQRSLVSLLTFPQRLAPLPSNTLRLD